MIKKTFEKVDECVFYEKLSNGIDVYLYPTKKTKNFYVSISVKYGARNTKFKLKDKIVEIIPGSAHFLEHKVMALSENKEISKRINDLGSLANAWTSYYGTNYNIFGSLNLEENIRLLLDIFYNIDINDKCVEEEKGIIGEEIDMYKDRIDSLMYSKLFDNLFTKSYVKNTVIGERSDIEKITAKGLNQIYDTYYSANNTFIIVCGDFDENNILEFIKNYMSNLKLKEVDVPKRIQDKETDEVNISYEEIKKEMNIDRVKIGFKIKRDIFGIKEESILRAYLNLILSLNLSATSKLFEEYKNENIVISMGSGVNVIDDYVILTVSAMCNDANVFIDRIKKDIRNLTINEKEFERKRKIMLKSYIMDFDNIEDIEYNICMSLMVENKVNYNEYSEIMDLNYKEITRILKLLNFDNISVIRTIK